MQRLHTSILKYAALVAAVSFLYRVKVIYAATQEEIHPGDVVFIPKYKQINFEQNFLGAKFAHSDILKEGKGTVPHLVSRVPDRIESKSDQIRFVEEAVDRQASAILISNNAGREIEHSTVTVSNTSTTIVSFDSQIAGGIQAGENLFVSPVDHDLTGEIMAEMAFDIFGPNGGDFVLLYSSPNAANQNKWVEAMRHAIATNPKFAKLNEIGSFYPAVDNASGYSNITLELVKAKQNGTFPNLGLIVAPTTSGCAAAAKTLLQNDLCNVMVVSGLALPAEVLEACEKGCVKDFAFWNNLNLGYLTFYAAHAILEGDIMGVAGETIHAGKLGSFLIENDPTRNSALRVILGNFTKYDAHNVERAAFVDCIQGFCGDSEQYFEQRFMQKYNKKLLAILPKIAGLISFLCSSYLCQYILKSSRLRKYIFQRIIVGMSFSDSISSLFGFFLSTWPMPRNTWLVHGAIGTEATCQMQGFLFQFGIVATPLYNCSLGCFYFLKIVHGWADEDIRKFEWLLHLVPLTVATITAIAGVVLKLYNPQSRGYMCWIEEFPPYCSSSLSCERGNNANIFRWSFLYGFVVFTFVWLIIVMTRSFLKVRRNEKAVDNFRTGNQPIDRRNSREISKQALFYVLAFGIPWIWGLIINSINTAQNVFESNRHDRIITAMSVVNAIIFPLQGLFNILVYVRPRYLKMKQKYPDKTFLAICLQVFTRNRNENRNRDVPSNERSTNRSSFRVSLNSLF